MDLLGRLDPKLDAKTEAEFRVHKGMRCLHWCYVLFADCQ